LKFFTIGKFGVTLIGCSVPRESTQEINDRCTGEWQCGDPIADEHARPAVNLPKQPMREY